MTDTKNLIQLNKAGNFYFICKDEEDGRDLWASASIDLSRKDFKKFGDDSFFQNIKNDCLTKFDMMNLMFVLPKLLFEKVKENEKDLFDKSKYFCLVQIMFLNSDNGPRLSCEIDFFK